ncbi:hypothetical protein GQ600_25472 [Phytophthora cactorum]|nr:hypothetical protein GQ600_25472 [Phytophthora cactorum]
MRHQNWKQSVISRPGFESRSFSGFHCRPIQQLRQCRHKSLCIALETAGLEGTVSTQFGSVPVHEMASFRRSVWLGDACFMLVMS